MNNDLYLEHYWPTPIFFTEHPDPSELNKQLEKDIYNWSKNHDGERFVRSNRGGWHSPTDMNDRPEYAEITDWIVSQVQRIKTDGLALHPSTDLILDNMWANINSKYDYNVRHNHPHANISGVYYVTAPEPKSKIWFHDPRQSYSMTELNHDADSKINRPDLWHDVHFDPTPGKLILFPSYLDHTVEQNMSDDARISISFNFYQAKMNPMI